MRSTARFLEGTLLGVALGVGLGFLVFRKTSERGLKGLWLGAPQPVSPQGATPSPGFAGGAPEAESWRMQPSGYEVGAVGTAAEPEPQVIPGVVEEPLSAAGPGISPVPVEEEEVSEETMPPIPAEMEAYTSVEVEPLDVEGIPVWAEIPLPDVEVVPDAEVAVDEAAVGESQVEEAAEGVVEEAVEEVEIEAVPVPSPADDLKARIEETRRRIRRELEQPFVVGGAAAAAEASLSSEAEPAIGEALSVAPEPEKPESEEHPPEEPGMGERPASEAEPKAVSPGGEFEVTAETEEGRQVSNADASAVDYDAMRSRIEETRSRLKAKAFDAMMTGESALLGRDPEDAEMKLPTPTEVDGEIVQTIDESLREEES